MNGSSNPPFWSYISYLGADWKKKKPLKTKQVHFDYKAANFCLCIYKRQCISYTYRYIMCLYKLQTDNNIPWEKSYGKSRGTIVCYLSIRRWRRWSRWPCVIPSRKHARGLSHSFSFSLSLSFYRTTIIYSVYTKTFCRSDRTPSSIPWHLMYKCKTDHPPSRPHFTSNIIIHSI